MNDYADLLNNFYGHCYAEGRCIFDEKCGSGRKAYCRFYKARVGSCFGSSEYPRLLIVGKEDVGSGDFSHVPITEPASVINVNNPHFLGTLYTAVRVLKGEKPASSNLEDLLSYEELRHNFCLTNYFKCVFKETDKHSGVKADIGMKHSCYHILMEEIQILRPDIIVIQGKFTADRFWTTLKELGRFEKEVFASTNKKFNITASEYHYSDGSPFFVIWSYHPCAQGGQWKKSLDVFNDAIETVKAQL